MFYKGMMNKEPNGGTTGVRCWDTHIQILMLVVSE